MRISEEDLKAVQHLKLRSVVATHELQRSNSELQLFMCELFTKYGFSLGTTIDEYTGEVKDPLASPESEAKTEPETTI